MSQPLGYNIGNALEVKEAIDLLKGQGPEDLKELSILLAAHMLMLAGSCCSLEAAQGKMLDLLVSGQALAKFDELVVAQGGHLDYRLPFYGLPQARIKEELIADRAGYIVELDALKVGHGAMLLGAGREKLGDSVDPAVGIELIRKCGDFVKDGEPLAIMHANQSTRLPVVREMLRKAYRLSDVPGNRPALVYQTVQA
jgi:pyrimidine-nucleoside phosphorylase